VYHIPGYRVIIILHRDGKVLATTHNFATNKTSGYERESAAIAFQSFAAVLGSPAAPVLLSSLPTLFDLYMDKGEVVRQAAAVATKAILKLFPPESTRFVFKMLEGVIENGKWRAKAGALDAMRTFVNGAEEAVATELATILPAVTAAMHDTKNEVCHILIVQSNVRWMCQRSPLLLSSARLHCVPLSLMRIWHRTSQYL